MSDIPRQYAMVKLTDEFREILQPYKLTKISGDMLAESFLIFLGEIPNMREHCILIGQSGTVYSGFHIEDFVELTEDET